MMYLVSVGWIIAEVVEQLAGTIKLVNPCLITEQGLMPMLHFVEEDDITVKEDNLLGSLLTPRPEIAKAHSTLFSKIIVPDSKIQLN